MNFTIRVTQKDIDCGDRGEPLSCPVARAIKRATIGINGSMFNFPWVGEKVTDLSMFGPRADNPPEIQDFIRAYDAGESVEPFNFEMEIDDDVWKLKRDKCYESEPDPVPDSEPYLDGNGR